MHQLRTQHRAELEPERVEFSPARMVEHEARGPGLAGGLVERRWQAGGEAEQIRIDLDPCAALANADRRAPCGRAGNTVEQRLRIARAHRCGVGTPDRLEAHHAIRTGLGAHRGRLAEKLRARLRDGEAVAGESHHASGALERRQAIEQLDAIAGKAEGALDRGVDRASQRHHQLEV